MTDAMLLRVVSTFLSKDASGRSCLIRFGSRMRNADIDLLLLTHGPTNWNTCSFGRLDLAAMQFDHFARLASMLDPMAIEPLLTGDVICGEKRLVQKLRVKISALGPSRESAHYLHDRSLEEYLSCHALISRFNDSKKPVFLLWAFINLGYAYSYRLMSHYYRSRPWAGPITVQELLRSGSGQAFEKLWKDVRIAKKRPTALKIGTIQYYQDLWMKGLVTT